MAFASFSVGPEKSLVNAACEAVPPLMAICGPNGAGKSTLLHLLKREVPRQAEPGTQVIYMGPHRAWRRSSPRASSLFEQSQYSFRSFLGMDSLPGFQYPVPGLQYITAFPRTPDSTDESQALVKFVIERLEMRRREKIAELFDQGGGRIEPGALGDIWAPLRTLTTYLLPHLTFDTVDTTNADNVRCVFRRVDADQSILIDIDDLSSGERSVIALFLPFLEHQILELLEPGEPEGVIPVALIDEPDLHLHPSLQVTFLEYLRRLATDGKAQFIIATHSPTLVDAATADELFLLAPVAAVAGGNQLIRLASSADRLEALRDIMGATHILTRCRPIVFVEGEHPSATAKTTDQRLIQLLIRESEGWVVVPSGGRTEVIAAVERLRATLPEGLPGIAAYCLVDADRSVDGDPDWVISWPVTMIENLLLDPEIIFQLLDPYREKTGLANVQAVATALQEIAEAQANDEVRLRIRETAPSFRLDFKDAARDSNVDALLDSSLDESRAWCVATHTREALREAITKAAAEVDSIVREARCLQAFRGKQILKTFCDKYAQIAGFSYPTFCIELARLAAKSERVTALTGQAVAKIQLYTPRQLISVIDLLVQQEPAGDTRESLLSVRGRVEQALDEFDSAAGRGVDRRQLRADLIRLARELAARGDRPELHRELAGLAVEIAA